MRVRWTYSLALLGLVLGIVARLAFRVLLGVPLDPMESLARVLAPIPVGFAAIVASRIPAPRAARVDPIVARRHV